MICRWKWKISYLLFWSINVPTTSKDFPCSTGDRPLTLSRDPDSNEDAPTLQAHSPVAMCDRWGKACSAYALIVIIPVFILLNYWRTADSTGAVQSVVPSPAATIPITLHYVNHESAKCLDGSKPAYYYRPGHGEGKDKWIVFFEGGGWCYDLEQCYLRSKTVLGSSKDYTPTLDNEVLKFYLSSSEQTNPLMFNWNTVLVKYCDGSSYAGDAIQSYKVSHHMIVSAKH